MVAELDCFNCLIMYLSAALFPTRFPIILIDLCFNLSLILAITPAVTGPRKRKVIVFNPICCISNFGCCALKRVSFRLPLRCGCRRFRGRPLGAGVAGGFGGLSSGGIGMGGTTGNEGMDQGSDEVESEEDPPRNLKFLHHPQSYRTCHQGGLMEGTSVLILLNDETKLGTVLSWGGGGGGGGGRRIDVASDGGIIG